MSNCDVIQASIELRQLKKSGLFKSRGKGKSTYYVPSDKLSTGVSDLSTGVKAVSTPPDDVSTPVLIDKSILEQIANLKAREHDASKVKSIIIQLCSKRAVKAVAIAKALGKGEDYVKRKYLTKMIDSGELTYLYPEMKNHPQQAYKTK